MNKLIQRFLQDERGLSTIECGVIFAGVVIAVAMLMKNFGDQLIPIFPAE